MNILFVCHGNINRSPSAMLLLRKKGIKTVDSAGIKGEGRKISKKMREILLKNCIKESRILKHRSKVLDKKLVKWANVIFYMDNGNLKNLIKMFPKARDKFEPLAKYLGIDKIKDPGFSKGTDVYKEVFKMIKKAIDNFSVEFNNKIDTPIFVPSKGRAGSSKLLSILEKSKLSHIVVVEKDDKKKYKKAYPNAEIMVLPKSNQGIAYSRKNIIESMMGNGWLWMADDDIYKFSRYEGNKFHEISLKDFLIKGESVINKYSNNKKIRLASVGYRQTPFGINNKPLVLNGRLIQFVGFNTDVLGEVEYDASLRAMGDEDFLIKIFMSGMNTIKINHYMYTCPYSAPKNQVGGINYKNNLKLRMVKKLVKRYPKIIRLVSEDGGMNGNPKYEISWGKICNRVDLKLKDTENVAIGGLDNYGILKWVKGV